MGWRCWVVVAMGVAGLAGPIRADDLHILPDASEPPLFAVTRPDNDLGPPDVRGAKPVEVPPAVASVVHTVAHATYARYVSDRTRCRSAACTSGPLPMRALYGPIVRIRAPQGRLLFVYRQDAEVGYSWYVPILFDPTRAVATSVPPRIYGKWTDAFEELTPSERHLLRAPIVAFDDVDQDGEPEVVVQERVHNGDAYNAALYHYFHVGDDLSLQRILALETRTGRLTRTLEKLGNGAVRIRVRLQRPALPREVGSVTLRTGTPGTPFTIVERTVRLPEYDGVLVTSSDRPEGDPDENTFLGTGEYARY